MSVKKYSDYIALHEQKTKTIGLRSESVLDEATTIRFTTGSKSWSDNQKKVSSIHKSLRNDHPDKVAKSFGGNSDGGYVTVKKKDHVDLIKQYIKKAGGNIVESNDEEANTQ